jgi:hypothetical protein
VGWNSAYARAGLSVYTNAWGARYEALQATETVVTVLNGRSQLPLAVQRGTTVLIPPQSYLIVGRGYGEALLVKQFPEPTDVALNLELLPPTWATLPNILGAGPLLIKNNAQVLDADLEKFQPDVKNSFAPRTAVGRLGDGRLVWVVVDRMSLKELASLMTSIGCSDALNLDGGGSTGLYLGGALRNRRGPERLLSTALLLVPK